MGKKNKVSDPKGKKKKAVRKTKCLPEEIEEDILSRLPVKTIVRFMSVCKSWYSLFHDPRFNSMHQRNNSSPILLLACLYDTAEFVVTDTWSSVVLYRLSLRPRLPSHVTHPIDDLHSHTSRVVPCNGIVFVHDKHLVVTSDQHVYQKFEFMCILNPALRVVKYIHLPGGGLMSAKTKVLVGFGFDRHSNDYKVIRYQESAIRKVEIYSLSSNSWRTVKAATRNTDHFFRSNHSRALASGVCVNETHHWVVITPYYGPRPDLSVIISFDMRREELKEITIPHEMRKRSLETLFKYKESLAMLTRIIGSYRNIGGYRKNTHEIWVMKDYGMSESWIKICTIDVPLENVFCLGFIEYSKELTFASVFDYGGAGSIVFDIDKLEMKDHSSTPNIEGLKDAIEVTTFRESLTLLGSKNLVHC